ncbi:MAG TPA: hypothetical protein VF079_06130 [Sphingomicrobium sp.]
MTSTSDPSYYAARLDAERAAAEAAACERARASHLELAEHYRQLLATSHPLHAVNGSSDPAQETPAGA